MRSASWWLTPKNGGTGDLQGAAENAGARLLASRHTGVTPGLSDCYSEAARVCLDRHHLSPTDFAVMHGSEAQEAQTKWDASDERLKHGWANETDATEAAAYALALAAIELTTGMVAVSRAEARTGADYHLGRGSGSPDDLEVLYRLEVSGVDQGDAFGDREPSPAEDSASEDGEQQPSGSRYYRGLRRKANPSRRREH